MRVRETDSDAIQKQYGRRLRAAWYARILLWRWQRTDGVERISWWTGVYDRQTDRPRRLIVQPGHTPGSHRRLSDGCTGPRRVKSGVSCRSITEFTRILTCRVFVTVAEPGIFIGGGGVTQGVWRRHWLLTFSTNQWQSPREWGFEPLFVSGPGSLTILYMWCHRNWRNCIQVAKIALKRTDFNATATVADPCSNPLTLELLSLTLDVT